MAADVYFVDMRARSGLNLLDKLEKLFKHAGFDQLIDPGDLVALKVHFGERGNLAYLRPQFLRRLVEQIKKKEGKAFLTDANTLYVGSRANAVDHLETAIENGFDYAVVGAPLVIADGLTGRDFTEVEIQQSHFEHVKIGTAIYQASSLIAVSHFKGHELTGFGGTIKNLGMGCGSRSGKQMMHSDVKPKVGHSVCIGCGKCVDWCPAQAIQLVEAEENSPQNPQPLNQKPGLKASIDPHTCIGCGECTVTCPIQAIQVRWKTTPQAIQEKIAEYALGVLQNKVGKAGFLNFLTDISPDCDCFAWNDAPIVADIGILASQDPVAIDQAAVDLVNEQPVLANSVIGSASEVQDRFLAVRSEIDWSPQLAYGEKIGLGTRQYNLIRI